MCQKCATEPPATGESIAAMPVADVLGWLAYNNPGDFLRFAISDYPDAVAEFVNQVRRTQAVAYLEHAVSAG